MTVPDEDDETREATDALSWPDTSRPIRGYAADETGFQQQPGYSGFPQPQAGPLSPYQPPYQQNYPPPYPPNYPPPYPPSWPQPYGPVHYPPAGRSAARWVVVVGVFLAGLAIGLALGAWLL
jgi:hypothetical protein